MSEQTQPTSALKRTPFHERHVALGARMVDFGGWDMPVQYPTGIIAEHLATRSGAGLFDVSHMGRFVLRGPGAVPFFQHALTNNAEALDPLQAQYTIVPTPSGGAVDDAYLYRFVESEYLLVVNASNRVKDWEHFEEHIRGFPDVELTDETGEIAMLALQGKAARDILAGLIVAGSLPEPRRNELSEATLRVPDPDGGSPLAILTISWSRSMISNSPRRRRATTRWKLFEPRSTAAKTLASHPGARDRAFAILNFVSLPR